jgi:hypothetical protein
MLADRLGTCIECVGSHLGEMVHQVSIKLDVGGDPFSVAMAEEIVKITVGGCQSLAHFAPAG